MLRRLKCKVIFVRTLNIQEDQVTRFSEKPKYAGNYVNGGFLVFNRAIFDYLDSIGISIIWSILLIS